VRALPAFLRSRGLRPRGYQGQALLRALAGRFPGLPPRVQVRVRADRVIPLDPAAALTAAPPLIGAGLVGLQQQRNPVLKEKANEGRFLSAHHRSDCLKP
jgi:hypothetical protein